jgi:hypothetical protein
MRVIEVYVHRYVQIRSHNRQMIRIEKRENGRRKEGKEGGRIDLNLINSRKCKYLSEHKLRMKACA